MIQGMNNQAAMGRTSFFAFGFQNSAAQVQQAPMGQVQQLNQLLQTAFKGFFQAASQFAFNQQGAGFGQPAAMSPGFVAPPNRQAMFPMNPASLPQTPMGMMRPEIPGGNNAMVRPGALAGGFMAGGFITFGGGQVQGGGFGTGFGEIAPKKGIEQLGPNKFKLSSGTIVEATGKSNEWTVTMPDGKKSRIWGDPHVEVFNKDGKMLKNGGKFDIKRQTSLTLPTGEKLTVEMTPPRANGYTVTKNVHIQDGSQRVSITGIDTNKPKSSGIKNDRYEFDAKMKDGDQIAISAKDGSWLLNGKNRILGSSKAGAEFRVGANVGQGELTQAAAMGMREVSAPMPRPGLGQLPRFGGQQHGLMMMMQMFQMMMAQMSQMQMGGMGFIR